MDKRVGLITDRPVPYGDDRLGHDEVAKELARIALSVDVPANIALYGRWGAGKSSIANALEAIIAKDAKAVWVRYDAFKWSGAAFQRHFLTQTAEQLREPFDSERLYGEKSTNVLHFSLKNLGRTLASSLGFVAVMVALLAGLFWVGHFVADQLGSDAAQRIADNVLVPITLLGAVTLMVKTLMGASMDTLKVTRTVSAPSSDEQFERQFEHLIRPSVQRGRRVVVFIDELDRCSASDVVQTLDAIRTFLDVEGCVCIVAADKQALETALSVAVAQETPHDATNPYYSTGGAYLDKVFAYQVALPAPLNRRLTSMASELARSTGGVWDDVEDSDRIVSVLIPTHVTSPRRVKALLNAYAVAYRLMERKIAANVVEGPASAREDELAKLVCLQVEFPLFARELATDHGLPAAILDLASEHVTSRVVRRERTARRFLDADLDVDVDISRKPPARGAVRHGSEDAEGVPDPAKVTSEATDSEPAAGAELNVDKPEAPEAESDEVRLVDQLVAYLRKTSHVDDPGPDLIHLEAMGSTHGLDPKLARELQDLAVDRSYRQLVAQVGELDEDGRTGAVLMLADSLRDEVGVDVENLLSAIFQILAGWHAKDLAGIANRVTDRLASELHRVELVEADRAGALALGIAATRPSRTQLLDQALQDAGGVLASPRFGHQILQHLDALAGSGYEQQAAVALGTRLTDPATADDAAQALAALPAAHAAMYAEFVEEVVEDQLLPDADEDGDAHAERVAAYGQTLAGLNVDEVALRMLAMPLLRVDTQTGRNAFENLLPKLGRSGQQRFADRALTAAVRRHRQGAWLDAVDWAANLNVAAHLRKLIATLWTNMIKAEPDRQTNNANLQAISRAVAQAGIDLSGTDQLPTELTSLGVPADEEGAKTAERLLTAAQELIEAGLLDGASLAEALRPTVLAWIRTPPAANNEQQLASLRSRLRAQASHLRRFVAFVSDSPKAADELVEALNEDCRADEDIRSWLVIYALGQTAGRSVTSQVGPERVATALGAHGSAAHEMLADWISLGLPSSDQLIAAVQGQALVQGKRTSAVADSLRQWSTTLDGSEVASFIGWVTANESISDWIYRVCDPSGPDPDTLAVRLSEAWESATNNNARARVLDVWLWAKDTLADQQQALIDDIFLDYLSLARDNKQAASMAPRYETLVSPPPYGTLTRLRTALKPLTDGPHGKAIRKAYESAGVLEPKKRGIGKWLGS